VDPALRALIHPSRTCSRAGTTVLGVSAILDMQKNEVRIIGGAWRSRRIRFAPTAGLRPTPDRVRETLFNWLGQTLDGLHCLDLFAGSGALGFEAASRGAGAVVMVERDAAALRALRNNAQLLAGPAHAQLVIAAGDSLEYVRTTPERFDVVFLDPPFASDLTAAALALLPLRLNPGARVYAEGARASDWPAGWTQLKHARAGQVHFALLSRD
jgi:16S rRNA (guanine966-N2)-methyltransferase